MAPGLPSRDEVSKLLRWAPELGVLSVSVRIEPGDRGRQWHTELRRRLRELDGAAEHPLRAALSATGERVLAHFGDGHPPAERGHIGFTEVATQGGREAWYSTQIPPAETSVLHGPRPAIMPLLVALEEGSPRAVAIVSNERVRLARWDAGALAELGTFELETMELDWRDRKAARPPDPAGAQGVSSSGHDRYDDRLEHNRKRFLAECGRLVAERAKAQALGEIVTAGPDELVRVLEQGMNGSPLRRRHLDSHDLISAPIGELEDRFTELIRAGHRERQLELAENVLERAAGGVRASSAPAEIADALLEGRVDHLLVTSSGQIADRAGDGEGGVTAEWLAERALETSATITTLDGEAAEKLVAAGGVAALFRY